MICILVIDDDRLVRFTIRTAIEQAGRSVVEVENGVLGLAAFDAVPFDLVITGLLMPEKEGVETVRWRSRSRRAGCCRPSPSCCSRTRHVMIRSGRSENGAQGRI